MQLNQIEDYKFQLIRNDLQEQNIDFLNDLIRLKCIFSKLMPKMPRQHIVKLLLDSVHQSLIIKINNKIVAGVSFRSFQDKKFYEIAFFGVNHQNQHKGIGKILMQKLKRIVQQREIQYLFTYADDKAIGFFRKNGFNCNITLPKVQYHHYIKQYIGGKLMYCQINPSIDYENLCQSLCEVEKKILQKIQEQIASTAQHQIEQTIKQVRIKRQKQQPLQWQNLIPGLRQAGYEKSMLSQQHVNLDYLLHCQYFIQQAYAKIHHLKLDQSPKVFQPKYQKFINLLKFIQRKLIAGKFKNKLEFRDQFVWELDIILGDQKLITIHQNEFKKKIDILVKQFMKGLLLDKTNKKKFKLTEIYQYPFK